ncbi:hypothetical protein [Halomonas alkalisoli]|uniref:hypothetical protein n=1 Tax=Halomonas alkalisoli TaxID=2907158 RepID=UPI001F3F0A18|nr:hypothetical protein [Halomonas alkalisoli]MCE9683687.1 hypothetical protein [Halomonas alkalisoli]
MRLVLVHGINQQGKELAMLRRTWLQDLEKGLDAPGALRDVVVDMPFYGDILFNLAGTKPSGAIAQGSNAEEDRDLAEFLAEGLAEQATEEGISSQEIAEEQQRLAADSAVAVDMGFPMSRRINAIVSVLERISPFRGDLALRLLDQAHAYLKKPHVGPAVDAEVKKTLSPGPVVLVTHSLGTVVSFKLLRTLAAEGTPVDVPLYVTLGSPLTLSTVQRALGPSFAPPPGVVRWVNARDPDDFISLNRGLVPPTFPTSIENLTDVRNVQAGAEDAHAIPGYLAHPPVARAIAEALGL